MRQRPERAVAGPTSKCACYLLAARDDFAGALVALVALAAAFLAGAFAVAAFLVVTVLAEAVLAVALAGRPGDRDVVVLVAAATLRPVPLALVVLAALVALVALAAVARPADAFAAAVFLAADFLALRSALKPVAGLKRIPLEAAILTGWPVRGLRPVRALREVGLKLPKP